MIIAVRCIYYKAVTPSCDILDLPYEKWMDFLHGDNESRKKMVCEVLNKEYLLSSVREIAWIPLENQNKLVVVE